MTQATLVPTMSADSDVSRSFTAPLPASSVVHRAHHDLIARLAQTKPARISGFAAEREDLEERASHLRDVLGAVMEYVELVAADTAAYAPIGAIDRKYLTAVLTDVANDVAGSIGFAAEH